MKGILLNEEGYVTYPKVIFDVVPEHVKALNWRISNVECCGNGDDYPFENTTDAFWISGTELYEIITNNAEVQWIWGLMSGFSKELSREEAFNEEYVDVASEGIQSYWNKPIAPFCKNAEMEIFAVDSSETYVMCKDDNIYSVLRKHFKESVDLETQIDIWKQDTGCK